MKSNQIKSNKVTYLSVFAMLFLQIGIAHAAPFNKETDSGIECSVSANQIIQLNTTVPIPLNDNMFINTVGFRYDEETNTFMSSFGLAAQGKARVIDFNQDELGVYGAYTDPAVIKEVGLTNNIARMLQNDAASKDDMRFEFRYHPGANGGSWQIKGILDPGLPGLPKNLYVDTSFHGVGNVNCRAILKSVPAPAPSSSQGTNSAGGKDKSSGKKDK